MDVSKLVGVHSYTDTVRDTYRTTAVSSMPGPLHASAQGSIRPTTVSIRGSPLVSMVPRMVLHHVWPGRSTGNICDAEAFVPCEQTGAKRTHTKTRGTVFL